MALNKRCGLKLCWQSGHKSDDFRLDLTKSNRPETPMTHDLLWKMMLWKSVKGINSCLYMRGGPKKILQITLNHCKFHSIFLFKVLSLNCDACCSASWCSVQCPPAILAEFHPQWHIFSFSVPISVSPNCRNIFNGKSNN